MSRPLIAAFHAKQSGAISWDEYIHNLFARCTGYQHPDDVSKDRLGLQLEITDPFAFSVWDWSNKIGNVQDTTPLEAVFKAYRHDTFDDVKNRLAALDGEPVPHMKGSLALLALQERRTDVLKLCLDQGGCEFGWPFKCEVEKVDKYKDPEVFRMLEEGQYRKLRSKGGVGAPPGTAGIFDKGGKLPVDW